ncbi:MAG: alanine racemase [Betaproteobacteria bacterium]|nr:alanine racemase [Betaproteobacteria bacterium]
MPRPLRARISLSALAGNLEVARRHAGEAKIWAVIKANAYGHGLRRAAKAFAAADGLAIIEFDAAARLRDAGETRPILLLEGFFGPQDIALLAEYALTPVIHNFTQIEILAKISPAAPIDVYLKVNSGMNRLGFTVDSLEAAWQALRSNPCVRSVALMTHFADADGPSGVQGQLDWFGEMIRPLEGNPAVPRSFANSAALLRYPEARGDWVRPGIMLYGCSPFAEQRAADLGLRPAMTLGSEIIAVQQVLPGERVGYGFAYKVEREMTLGIVACGYADGYPRHAPSGTPVLVNGFDSCIVGRVSMDMLCVDLTGIPGAGVGMPVTLWGEGLSADLVAAAAGTVSYELLCALAPRVPVLEVA